MIDTLETKVQQLANLWCPSGSPQASALSSDINALIAAARREAMEEAANRKYRLGERVTKIKGSSWTGRIVGFYTTTLTPIGYAVESETESGSVQIYPESAIRALPLDPIPDAGKLRTGGGDEG